MRTDRGEARYGTCTTYDATLEGPLPSRRYVGPTDSGYRTTRQEVGTYSTRTG